MRVMKRRTSRRILSAFGVKVDGGRCIGCDKCVKACKMDVKKVGDAECINCGECMEVCPVNAISLGYKGPAADLKKQQEK